VWGGGANPTRGGGRSSIPRRLDQKTDGSSNPSGAERAKERLTGKSGDVTQVRHNLTLRDSLMGDEAGDLMRSGAEKNS